ncbi:GntR family transcriptional regulator [Acuticoccus sediminis]|uniref:GntR family transcriptional regulator n=1 Tax=Acuticoccus sediminis TaxID=2184697 RepID=UPI001CFF0500|nr:FCD domain-containing protein [Acuticoccus sediminis]
MGGSWRLSEELNAQDPARLDGETLADFAYRAIRSDIISGVRPPGERLQIEKLKKIYEIGPTPIREALQKLSVEQLVFGEGNRGFTVAPLDPAEFHDLNIARTEVEMAALRRAIELGDGAWEARVVAAAYTMKKADADLPEEGSVSDGWERANAAFHRAMVDACGSHWLLRTRSMLQDLCERYRRASLRDKRRERDLGAEHAAIAEAVLARDADAACELTRRHFQITAAHLDVATSAPLRGAGRR